MRKPIIVLSLAAVALLAAGGGCTSSDTTKTNANTKPAANTNTTKSNTNEKVNDVAKATFDAAAKPKAILADKNGQWATTATASSEYGADSWSAKQATGKPNVDVFGDNSSAWAPLEKNKGVETLELSYAKAVNALGVRVHETYGVGTITKVELKDSEGTYYTIWEGDDSLTDIGYLQAPVEKTDYLVNGVKLTFDTTKVATEWAEVDAVQLVGVSE